MTHTASRTSFLLYQCAQCGQQNLRRITVQGQASGSYHALQKQTTKDRVTANAASSAGVVLNRQDQALFEGINIRRDYTCLKEKIICPHCHAEQPWSRISDRWKAHPLFGLWVIGVIFCSLLALLMVMIPPHVVGIVFLLLDLVLLSFPFIYRSKRRKKQRHLQEIRFMFPIYYNQTNLQELMNSPAAPLLKKELDMLAAERAKSAR